MKQLPKFLIAHNVASAPDTLYLVHTQTPMFIGIVFPFAGEIKIVPEILKEYNIEAGCRTNRLPTGEYYIMAVVKWIEKPDMKQVPKLMRRTGDWLFNYMNKLQK